MWVLILFKLEPVYKKYMRAVVGQSSALDVGTHAIQKCHEEWTKMTSVCYCVLDLIISLLLIIIS